MEWAFTNSFSPTQGARDSAAPLHRSPHARDVPIPGWMSGSECNYAARRRIPPDSPACRNADRALFPVWVEFAFAPGRS